VHRQHTHARCLAAIVFAIKDNESRVHAHRREWLTSQCHGACMARRAACSCVNVYRASPSLGAGRQAALLALAQSQLTMRANQQRLANETVDLAVGPATCSLRQLPQVLVTRWARGAAPCVAQGLQQTPASRGQVNCNQKVADEPIPVVQATRRMRI
jgi:hypothetical protein